MRYQVGDKVRVLTDGDSGFGYDFLAGEDALGNPSEVMETDDESTLKYFVKMPSSYGTWMYENDLRPYNPSSKFQLLKQKEDGEEWVAWLDKYTRFVENGKPALLAEESAMWNDLYSLYKGFKMFQFHIEDTSPMFKFDVPKAPVFELRPYGACVEAINCLIIEGVFLNEDGQSILDELRKALGVGGLGMYVVRFASALHIHFKGEGQKALYPQIVEQFQAAVEKIGGSVTVNKL